MARTSRRRFLQWAGAGAIGATALAGSVRAERKQAPPAEPPDKPAAGKPNILLIITDQQAATMLSCAGNKWVKTPAMDSLMKKGMRFEKAYATNPVCMPSRFSLLTGHYPSNVSMRMNCNGKGTDRFVSLAMGHAFRAAGYKCVYGGKVHLPGKLRDITDCGFDRLTGNERGELAKECAAFLKQPQDQPFLLVASFINPHDICYQAIMAHALKTGSRGRNNEAVSVMQQAEKTPQGVTEEQFYAKLCPPLPDNHEPTENEPKGIPAGLKARAFKPWIRENWGEREWRRHRWAYCRLTERVDGQIGMVLDALGKAGLEDDTIVVFTSDHGDMDASHRMEHKSWTYEQAARIPLIVQYPPLTRPGHVDTSHLVSNGLDLLPTLCDLASVKPPSNLAGLSIKPLLGGEEPPSWRKHLMIEAEFSHGVTDGRYKYTLFDSAGPEELLCDLQTDPGEMKNLAGKKEYSDVLARLRKALARQIAIHNGKLPYDVPGTDKPPIT